MEVDESIGQFFTGVNSVVANAAGSSRSYRLLALRSLYQNRGPDKQKCYQEAVY